LFPALNMAFQIRSCCALERQDSAGALEAAAVHAPLARLIFDENQEDAGTVLSYALTMMDFAGSAALLSDNDKLDEATHRLDEAAESSIRSATEEAATISGFEITSDKLKVRFRRLTAAAKQQNRAARPFLNPIYRASFPVPKHCRPIPGGSRQSDSPCCSRRIIVSGQAR